MPQASLVPLESRQSPMLKRATPNVAVQYAKSVYPASTELPGYHQSKPVNPIRKVGDPLHLRTHSVQCGRFHGGAAFRNFLRRRNHCHAQRRNFRRRLYFAGFGFLRVYCETWVVTDGNLQHHRMKTEWR